MNQKFNFDKYIKERNNKDHIKLLFIRKNSYKTTNVILNNNYVNEINNFEYKFKIKNNNIYLKDNKLKNINKFHFINKNFNKSNNNHAFNENYNLNNKNNNNNKKINLKENYNSFFNLYTKNLLNRNNNYIEHLSKNYSISNNLFKTYNIKDKSRNDIKNYINSNILFPKISNNNKFLSKSLSFNNMNNIKKFYKEKKYDLGKSNLQHNPITNI